MANTFNKTTWVDNSAPAITASQLNRIENGIDAVNTLANSLETQVAKDFNLDLGTEIASGTDLNTLTTIGTYHSPSASVSASLLNCPISNRGFKLLVLPQGYSGLSYGAQLILVSEGGAVSSGYNSIYMRSYWGSSGWTAWSKIALASGNGSIYSLGEEISSGADLDNYMTPGSYYSPSATVSASLSHVPSTSSGFRLEVKTTITSTRLIQVAYYNLSAVVIFVRAYTQDGWGDWERLMRASEVGYSSESFNITLGDINTSVTVRKFGRVAVMSVNMGSTTGTPFSGVSDNPVLGTLPEAFRPAGTVNIYSPVIGRTAGGWASADYYHFVAGIIPSTGALQLFGKTSDLKLCRFITFEITFITV